MEFESFGKIPRLSRRCVITEKIDGTNGQIFISDDGLMQVGSRNRWIDAQTDNHGFYKWAWEHVDELVTKLGPGRHFGEWWGQGIGRAYGLKEKRFSLFNTSRWNDPSLRPSCCAVVPVLYEGMFDSESIRDMLSCLDANGSLAAPGFMRPEGIVIFHRASNMLFKKTLENDDVPKGSQEIA